MMDVNEREERQQTKMQEASARALARALESLEGLCCGDAFGECFFTSENRTQDARALRTLPGAPWRYTDDTVMAVSVVASLERFGAIEPEWLAGSFVRHYRPERGYGQAMHGLLTRLSAIGAANWFEEAQLLFAGQGSFGNGAAMRVAPLGAYFAHDLDLAIEQATHSAIATHCHTEGIAGAVAVAVAAAIAGRDRGCVAVSAQHFLEEIISRTPKSAVREGIARALALPAPTTTLEAALTIGNGARCSAQDTVPFALWCAARSLENYEEALWQTIDGGGDMDTNCAIVGGVVAARTGAQAIPAEWLARREPIGPLLQAARQED